MKTKMIYCVLVNKKTDYVKAISIFLLTVFYYPVFNVIRGYFINKYIKNSLNYINRILIITLIFALIVLVCIKFTRFIKRNRESIVLLGTSPLKIFLLFILTKYEIFFLQIYLGSMMCQMQGMEIGSAILANIVNAVFIYMIGIIIGLKSRAKHLAFLTAGAAAILGIVIGLEKLTYDSLYKIIMSNFAEFILFPDLLNAVILRPVTVLSLLLILAYACKNTNTDIAVDEGNTFRLNMTGDITHKFGKYLACKKNYFWIYRSKDFIIWKVFSTVIFIILCCTISNSIDIFLAAYGISLITAFYFYDIYSFEREHLFLYFMSNYSYRQLIWDYTIAGMCILGDNILVILIIRCIFNPGNLIVVPLLLISIIYISVFVNSDLYKKYPMRLFNIMALSALIKMHLPVLNIYFLYRNILKGKDNWDTLSYEDEQ